MPQRRRRSVHVCVSVVFGMSLKRIVGLATNAEITDLDFLEKYRKY